MVDRLSTAKLELSKAFFPTNLHDFEKTAGVGFLIDLPLLLQQIFKGFEFQISG